MAWAVMVTFVISGLWHGAAWNYVVWGALNGLGVLAVSLVSRRRNGKWLDSRHEFAEPNPLWSAPRTLLQMLLTFTFICLTWIFFRARSLDDAWLILQTITGFTASPDSKPLQGLSSTLTLSLMAFLVLAEWIQRRHPHPLTLDGWPRSLRWTAYTALIWGTLFLKPFAKTGQFIYFQF